MVGCCKDQPSTVKLVSQLRAICEVVRIPSDAKFNADYNVNVVAQNYKLTKLEEYLTMDYDYKVDVVVQNYTLTELEECLSMDILYSAAERK